MGRWKTAAGFAAAFAGVGAVGGLLGVAFVYSGLFNVRASKPHTALSEWVTKTTMIHSVRRHAAAIEVPPRRFGTAEVLSGFCTYETHCVSCHGAAGVARQRWANGFTPDPPYLLDAADKWRPRELYWIIRNGTKMTAMTAWQWELDEAATWNVVAWLEASRRLPPETYVQLRRGGRCPPPARAALTPLMLHCNISPEPLCRGSNISGKSR